MYDVKNNIIICNNTDVTLHGVMLFQIKHDIW